MIKAAEPDLLSSLYIEAHTEPDGDDSADIRELCGQAHDAILALRAALELLIQVVEHANPGAFDNGVYGPEGQNEGVYLASRAVDGARAALREPVAEGVERE